MLYSQLIYQDKKQEFDRSLVLSEYLASFWNSEAVTKARAQRLSMNEDSGTRISDEEFKEFVINDEYKNNEYIDIIKNLAKAKEEGKLKYRRPSDKSKLPDDLSSISSVFNKFGDK